MKEERKIVKAEESTYPKAIHMQGSVLLQSLDLN